MKDTKSINDWTYYVRMSSLALVSVICPLLSPYLNTEVEILIILFGM